MKKTNQANDPYVRLPHAMMDSAAFKTLSTDAAWLFNQLLRQFKSLKGGYGHLVLPFADVKYKLSWRAFKEAQAELITGGFIWLVQEGGLKHLLPGHGGAAVFAAGRDKALGERWRERSKALVADPQAGHVRMARREKDDKDPVAIWEPVKPTTPRTIANRENWKKASKAIDQKRRKRSDIRQRGIRESHPLKPSRNRDHTESEQ